MTMTWYANALRVGLGVYQCHPCPAIHYEQVCVIAYPFCPMDHEHEA